MSANNFLLITGKKPLGYYEITEMSMEGGIIALINNAETLDEAITKAEKYCKTDMVEYGIRFSINT